MACVKMGISFTGIVDYFNTVHTNLVTRDTTAVCITLLYIGLFLCMLNVCTMSVFQIHCDGE